jgi:hypothetical protein
MNLEKTDKEQRWICSNRGTTTNLQRRRDKVMEVREIEENKFMSFKAIRSIFLLHLMTNYSRVLVGW